MTATVDTVPDLAATDQELRHGFASFVEAAHRLEQSYGELKERAARVDVQLAEANAELAQTLAERQAVFDALPTGVLALAPDGARRWTNPECARVLDAAHRLGVDPLGLDDGEHDVGGALSIRVARVALPDGGQLVMLEDRTRMTHLEREVDRLDRLAGLSELALGVAHEIKNPLNAVMGFASLMERQEDPDVIRRGARKIGAGMREVDAIVKAMLAFAQPTDGRTVAPRPVAESIQTAANEAGLPHSRLQVEGARAVVADGATLTRVLANLFRNSTEAGAEQVSVRVTQGDDLVIDVIDDGPGVGAHDGDRVFQPFVSTKVRGHGLGLALVARVLSFLGGSIELRNPGDSGAHFRVKIPGASATSDPQAEAHGRV